ncbi:MAG: SDR family NAD(P)-dependent oxidoreductase [Pyrinomonadaceae bacterium]
MRCLVTGATGFVGRAVVRELASRGHRIFAAGGPQGRGAGSFGELNSVTPLSLDVASSESVAGLSRHAPFDSVIHCAGIAHRFGAVADDEYQRVNVEGVRNVADAAGRSGCRRFVLVSSVLVYGRSARTSGRPVDEFDPCLPEDAYAQSKLEGETAAREACRELGVGLTILRPAPIIGEGSRGNFARLIRAIDRGRFVNVGRGDDLKSLVYVGDVAAVAAELAERSAAELEIFNLAAPPESTGEIVRIVCAALGRPTPRLTIPGGLPRAILGAAARLPLAGRRLANLRRSIETWLAEDIYSADRLAAEYGIVPRVAIRAAIGREVAAYRNETK